MLGGIGGRRRGRQSMSRLDGITNSWSLLRLMSIESVIPTNHLILCCPLPSIFPSIRVFSNESVLHIGWPKYWSFSFSISPCSEYSGLISLGWTGLISLQPKGTLKSLLQQHSSKTFFIVQLSHPFMTTGKTIALTRWISSLLVATESSKGAS